MTTIAEPRTYGNWIKPGSPGLGRLGLVGTVLLFAGIALAVIVKSAFGLLGAALVLVLELPALAPLLWQDRTGRNGWQVLIREVAWRTGVAKGQHVYLAGLVDAQLFGSTKLPGLLAASRLHEFTTAAGQKVAMVEHPKVRHFAVQVRVQPDGSSLVDPATADQWVAHWGVFQADLATEPALVGATATVQTSPDPGNRLAREVDRLLVPAAPQLARDMLLEAAATYPKGAAMVDAWVTLIFTANRRDTAGDELVAGGPRSRVRTPAEMATLIAARLPGLIAQLAATGAGVGTPMSAREVTDLVRVAYDPASAEDLATVRDAGEEAPIGWEQAGPAGAQESRGAYRHDGAASISWTMDGPPRSAVQSRVLTSLLAPHPDVDRKRLTILYRPYEPGDAAAVVDAQVRTATGKEDGKATGTVHTERAMATAREEAGGAGLTRFSMVLTSTVRDPERLGQAGETSMQLGRASKLTLRRAYGCQAAAFAAGLGIGVIASEYVNVPATVRGAL